MQRLTKRLQKKQLQKTKPQKPEAKSNKNSGSDGKQQKHKYRKEIVDEEVSDEEQNNGSWVVEKRNVDRGGKNAVKNDKCEKNTKSKGFTDDNQKWLKPLVSDEESESADALGSDEDADEVNDDLLPIEKANEKLKKRQSKESKLAAKEMQMSIDSQEVFKFPEENNEEQIELTLQEIQQRIKDITLVLSDFNKYRQADRSRTEYLDLLRHDLCIYYSYNDFLMGKLIDMFPLTELMEYLEASEVIKYKICIV